ncbi:thioredoxin domain-containing protein 2 [Mayamaea pseudoterrestris]|nr:thioredoxin domain-containing protein 2 [Mayamaea pseudoterrestris]
MTVQKITNLEEYNALLETSKSKLVILDFSAEWCGPCKFIHPIFEKMAEENPDVVFAEVDVDEADDVAGQCKVRAMPTFHFYKGGEKIEEMMGADKDKLAALMKTHKYMQ